MEDLQFILLLVIILICLAVLTILYFFTKPGSKYYPFDGSHPVEEDEIIDGTPPVGPRPLPLRLPRARIFWIPPPLEDPPPPYPGLVVESTKQNEMTKDVVICILDPSTLDEKNNLFVHPF